MGSSTKRLEQHIGKRLRALRRQHDMSLEQVAEILDVTQQQMSRYELGHHRLSAAQLYRLAQGLNVPIAWFFEEYQEDPDELARLEVALREERSAYFAATEKDKELAVISAWRALPTPLQRARVLALLEAFGFGI